MACVFREIKVVFTYIDFVEFFVFLMIRWASNLGSPLHNPLQGCGRTISQGIGVFLRVVEQVRTDRETKIFVPLQYQGKTQC